jgi:hypothetical protein
MWVDGKSFRVVSTESSGMNPIRVFKVLLEEDSDNPKVYLWEEQYNLSTRESRWKLMDDSEKVVCAGVSL